MKKATVRLISTSACIAIAVYLLLFIFIFRDGKNVALVYEVNPVKTPDLVEVRLPYLDESGYLKGKYADVYLSTEPDRPYDVTLAPSARRDVLSKNGDFRFPEDEAKLSQANVYYHINKIRDWFADSRGYSFDGPVKCYVLHKPLHVPARYVPLQRDIRFGISDDGTNPALNAGSIYHEYTHAVLHDIMILNDEYESSAVGEAYANYFSCSVLDDPRYREYTRLFSKGPPQIKGFPMDEIEKKRMHGDLNNEKRYPEDLVYDEHDSSEILSGAFWDLRKRLGPKTADSIIFEAYKSLNDIPDKYFFNSTKAGGPYFSAVFQALLLVDREIYKGKNEDVLRRTFLGRGIPEEPYPYQPSYRFGSNIKIGWYPDDYDVFYDLYWPGVYRIGKDGRLFGRIPAAYKDMTLRLYDENNELADNFSTRMKIFQGKDKDHKMFLAEFVIPASVKAGKHRLQFDCVDGATEEIRKSNAVLITLVE